MVRAECAVPVFYPTLAECQGSWEDYVTKLEPSFREVGICKIVPPKEWKPSTVPRLEKQEVTIKRPIEQRVTGRQGVFRALLLTRKEMSLQEEFRPLAGQPNNQAPPGVTGEELERTFWRSMHHHAPIYGADVEASFFDKNLKAWNMHKLDSLLTRVLEDRIPGVNTPYLYFGMWRSFFGWHTEDMELHSVNYLHYGAPKQWYCVPPAHRERFETWVKGMLPDCFRACSEFFRHKELLISPKRLKDAWIPFVKMVQHPGEMVINYPGAYHSGFNCGFNCAESTNFATLSWIQFGAEADCCTCREDAVNIDMRRFLPHADEETREVIEHNFVSDSDSETSEDLSGSESGDAIELIEESPSESEADDDDNSSDYDATSSDCEADLNAELTYRSRSRGRRASSMGTQQQQAKRKRKENCSPALPVKRGRPPLGKLARPGPSGLTEKEPRASAKSRGEETAATAAQSGVERHAESREPRTPTSGSGRARRLRGPPASRQGRGQDAGGAGAVASEQDTGAETEQSREQEAVSSGEEYRPACQLRASTKAGGRTGTGSCPSRGAAKNTRAASRTRKHTLDDCEDLIG